MDIQHVTHEAALAMRERDFDKALRLLKQSLTLSRRNLANMNDNDEQGTADTSSSHVMVCIPALDDTSLSAVEDGSVNNDFLLFDRLFVPSNHDSAARQSMACLYNLALCHHLAAFCRARRDPLAMLQKATFLYRMGITTTEQLVNEQQEDDDEDPDPFVVILYLAFLNNNGHVSSHLLEHQESRWHAETIRNTVLAHVVSSRQGRGDPFSTTTRMETIPDGRPVSALSFFCPLRFSPSQSTPAPAA